MVEVMGIQVGFKKTEIGYIPSDWLLVSYEEAFDFYPTASYSRTQLSKNDEIGYVHYGDVHTKCFHFLDFDKVTLPSIKNELLKKYPLLKDGDLIVVDASEDYEGVGKSVEVRNLKNRKAISGLHTFLLRDKKGTIANGFKGYLHSNVLVKKQMDTLATGLKVYGVSKTNLKLIQIPLPPTKVEQTAIATALNDADALITLLEKFSAKKRAIKQGAMQELLSGRKRLPEFEIKNGYKQTELGIIPSDWNVVSLGRIAAITKLAGFEYTKYFNSYKDGGDIIVLRGTNITHNVLDLSDVKTIPNSTSKNLQRSKLFKGDLVFAYVGTIGPVYLVEENGKFHLGPNTSKITLDKNCDTAYVFNYFKSWLIKNEIFEHTSIGAQPSLSMSKIRKFRVILPPTKAEQIAIANVLNDMDAEIETLEKKLEKFKLVKYGMMQNLLSGKIRLI